MSRYNHFSEDRTREYETSRTYNHLMYWIAAGVSTIVLLFLFFASREHIPETDYWLFKVYLLLASGGVAASWCAAFLRSREIESYAIWIYIGAIALNMRHWFLLAAAIVVCAVAYFANED